MWVVVAALAIVYFVVALISIKTFGWAGLAGIWAAGMLASYALSLIGKDRFDFKWLLISPLAFFLIGGIAGSIVLLPLQILGIVPSSSHYVSDDDFWSHR